MSLIIKIPTNTFTDATLPKLYREGLFNLGSLYCFDFVDIYCFAKQAAPNTGDIFNNLVDGAAAASAVIAGAGDVTFTGGGLYFNNPAASSYLDLGSSYDLSVSSPSHLRIVWLKQPAGYSTTGNQVPVGRGSTYTTNNTQSQIEIDALRNIQTRVGNQTIGSNTYSSGVPTDVDAVCQIGMHWNSSNGSISLYKNGTLIGAAGVQTGPLGQAAGQNEKIGGRASSGLNSFKGVVYRAYLENLTVSGAVAADQVAADYTANTGRFT